MNLTSLLACLAAWSHLQACPPASNKQDMLQISPTAAAPAASTVQERGQALPAPRFSGFYLGASAGYGLMDSDQQLDRGNNHGHAHVSPGGFVGSLTAGYNFALSDIAVAGVEADLGIAAISDDDKAVFDGHAWKPDYGPLWGTLRARIGMSLADSMLLYATGGVAFMQTDSWTVGNNFNESSWDAKLRTGFVVGAGIEYALNEAWSAKAEYLYMDFGRHHGYTEDADPYWYDDRAHIIRIGINHRF